MTIIRITLLCLCEIFFINLQEEAKGWRGIIPLHSTRIEVEKLLGPSSDQCQCGYYLKGMNVSVLYANGLDCGVAEQRDWRVGGWKVPRDTVVEITVYFTTEKRFSDLKIDESKYKKEVDEELPGNFYYTNMDEGITISVVGSIVRSISYFPTAKDMSLRCPDSNAKPLCNKPSKQP